MSPAFRDPKPQLRLVRGEGTPGADASSARASVPAFDDSELLSAMRAGDTAAASAFHDRVRPQVDRTLYRLLGRRDVDHDDIAQLALIELVYTIDRFRGDCSLDSWVSTLTAHVVYKHLRRRKTERRIFAGPDDVAPASTRGHGGAVAVRQVMERVQRLLDDIDEAKAWTYVLHDVCGYDLKEIAQITGVTVAAAQTRLVRGRRELHERIQRDPELVAELMEGVAHE
jgi:RNA polymerase sigma-70 factor (ECF subfamily)